MDSNAVKCGHTLGSIDLLHLKRYSTQQPYFSPPISLFSLLEHSLHLKLVPKKYV